MSRRNAIITVAVVAVCMATASIAEAAGRRRAGVKGRPKPSATAYTVVNSTSKSWYTWILSGTVQANTIAEGNAQGAKVIAPGGKAVFNVKPDGGGNEFGDFIVINAVPPLDVNNPNANFRGGWEVGNGNDSDIGTLKAGQTKTITITQSAVDVPPDITVAP
jgi:hypothetical protein